MWALKTSLYMVHEQGAAKNVWASQKSAVSELQLNCFPEQLAAPPAYYDMQLKCLPSFFYLFAFIKLIDIDLLLLNCCFQDHLLHSADCWQRQRDTVRTLGWKIHLNKDEDDEDEDLSASRLKMQDLENAGPRKNGPSCRAGKCITFTTFKVTRFRRWGRQLNSTEISMVGPTLKQNSSLVDSRHRALGPSFSRSCIVQLLKIFGPSFSGPANSASPVSGLRHCRRCHSLALGSEFHFTFHVNIVSLLTYLLTYLLDQLFTSFGLRGTVLSWTEIYICGVYHSVVSRHNVYAQGHDKQAAASTECGGSCGHRQAEVWPRPVSASSHWASLAWHTWTCQV